LGCGHPVDFEHLVRFCCREHGEEKFNRRLIVSGSEDDRLCSSSHRVATIALDQKTAALAEEAFEVRAVRSPPKTSVEVSGEVGIASCPFPDRH
jgi:hypothetical protein